MGLEGLPKNEESENFESFFTFNEDKDAKEPSSSEEDYAKINLKSLPRLDSIVS